MHAFREPTEIKITPNPEAEPIHGEWFDRYRVTLKLQMGDPEPLMRLLVPDAFEDM